MSISRKSLRHNAISLYIIQFASFFVPLITLPYLSRVLEPEIFGVYLFSQATALLLQFIPEYGFNLSATRTISQNRDQLEYLNRFVFGVIAAKIGLISLLIPICLVIWLTVPVFVDNPVYLIGSFALALTLGFNNHWYFRGIERMSVPAGWVLVANLLYVGLVLLLVNSPQEGHYALFLQAAMIGSAHLGLIIYMARHFSLKIPDLKIVEEALRDGWSLFLSRGAINIYTRTNTFVLGFFIPAEGIGMYNGGEKIVKAANRFLKPLSETFFPRMSEYVIEDSSKENVFRVKITLVMVGVALAGTFGLILAAPYVVPIIFGEGYDRVVPVIQIMAISLPFIAINNVLGVQWMIPHGLDSSYQNILISAGGVNLVLAVLFAYKTGIFGVAALVPAIEVYVGVLMIISLIRHKKFRMVN